MKIRIYQKSGGDFSPPPPHNPLVFYSPCTDSIEIVIETLHCGLRRPWCQSKYSVLEYFISYVLSYKWWYQIHAVLYLHFVVKSFKWKICIKYKWVFIINFSLKVSDYPFKQNRNILKKNMKVLLYTYFYNIS